MEHPARETLVSYLYDELDGSASEDVRHHIAECDACHAEIEGWRRVVEFLGEDQAPSMRSRPAVGLWRAAQIAAAALIVFATGLVIGWSSRHDAQALNQAVAGLREELGSSVRNSVIRSLEPELARRIDARVAERVPEVVSAQLEGTLPGAVDAQVQQARSEVEGILRDGYARDVRRLANYTIHAADQRTNASLVAFAEAFNASRLEDRQALIDWLRRAEQDRADELQIVRQDMTALAALTGDELTRTRQQIARLIAYAAPSEGAGEPSYRSHDAQKGQ
ncbi:zf-HC2 domain-containing protein [Candidatus Poribacteria bacterium]|nr:zf-HC2 domain-containing protein [Candidatus Poribacteria bacterium]